MVELVSDNIAIQLYERLLAGIVIFEYQKKDGSIRLAIGTLNTELIPPKKEVFNNLISLAKDTLTLLLMINNSNEFDEGRKVLGEKINEVLSSKVKKERDLNNGTQAYYDFEAQSWRSYTISSVYKVYIYR